MQTQPVRTEQIEKAAQHPRFSRLDWLFGALLFALYAPVVAQTARRWFMAEQYAHGVFIFPLVCGLLWVKREAIRDAPRQPSAWGLAPLALGLSAQAVSHALKIEFMGMLSLLPTLAGGIVLLHGPALWRIVRFPVLFLGFAANLPAPVLNGLSHAVQSASATSAAGITKALGFVIARQGNVLHVPGMTLEVAEVCSGFRKLTALIVFATLYGYLYPIRNLRRASLVLLVLPIALVANIARLCVLIAAATWGGARWEKGLHDPAELAVLLVSFGLMAVIGRRLGCVRPRFARDWVCS